VHTHLQRHPVTTTTRIKEDCAISLPTILRALKALESLDVVRETTGKYRHKVFIYEKYLNALNQGTEPMAR
jgi:Fe2+ or Zn2+ uptake regulation protein